MAKISEENDFYGFWLQDGSYLREPWIKTDKCAIATKSLLLGSCVAPGYFREPTLIAHARFKV